MTQLAGGARFVCKKMGRRETRQIHGCSLTHAPNRNYSLSPSKRGEGWGRGVRDCKILAPHPAPLLLGGGEGENSARVSRCARANSRRRFFWKNPFARRNIKPMKTDRLSRLCGSPSIPWIGFKLHRPAFDIFQESEVAALCRGAATPVLQRPPLIIPQRCQTQCEGVT